MIDDKWIYPNSKLTLEMAGLLTMEEYIAKRKETVSMYVNSTEIYNKCMRSKPSSRCSNQLVWWKKLKNERENSENVTEISGQN
jgi:hypothetical protein